MYVILSTEHHSLECEVFIQYYSQIVNILSASAKELSTEFVQNDIILHERQQEIFSIPSPTKAAGLLLNTISSALISGCNKGFYKFLDITEQYDNSDIKHLISAIRKKLLVLEPKDKGILMVIIYKIYEYIASFTHNVCIYILISYITTS